MGAERAARVVCAGAKGGLKCEAVTTSSSSAHRRMKKSGERVMTGDEGG